MTRHNSSTQDNQKWWQATTIYQIYPRSYMDGNGDGIGDIEGIISKLDYIRALGFETIWFSPFFASPQADFGYDISDYLAIAPEYGDMDSAERLIEAVHERGMAIVFDLVMNHTSDQHPWFLESSSSRDNPKADWYIWRDGRGDKPPNNWKNMLGKRGWHYVPARDQWYFASFLPFQPDLNYRHPPVKETMLDVTRFWLKKGVDGFRLDIFNVIYKDGQFRDNPRRLNPFSPEGVEGGFFQKNLYTANLPETMEFAKELRSVVDEFDDPPRFLLGELMGSHQEIRGFMGETGDGLNLSFLFDILNFRFTAAFFREKLKAYEREFGLPLIPTYVFSNHDVFRSIGRIGADHQKAKLLALFQFTVRGVAVTYQGEEIGMTDTSVPKREALDPISDLFGWIPQFARKWMPQLINRDECRTPMQWDDTANAGFSPAGVTTWLPLNQNYVQVNVESQLGDPDSLLEAYQALLVLRREKGALKWGRLALLEAGIPPEVLAYRRLHDSSQLTIYLNFSQRELSFSDLASSGQVIFKTGTSNQVVEGSVTLGPFGGMITEWTEI